MSDHPSIQCPGCGAKLALKSKPAAGSYLVCPHCNKRMVIGSAPNRQQAQPLAQPAPRTSPIQIPAATSTEQSSMWMPPRREVEPDHKASKLKRSQEQGAAEPLSREAWATIIVGGISGILLLMLIGIGVRMLVFRKSEPKADVIAAEQPAPVVDPNAKSVSASLLSATTEIYGEEALTRFRDTLTEYDPDFWKTTSVEETKLAANQPLRDVKQVRELQKLAMDQLKIDRPAAERFDANKASHVELDLRIVAQLLRKEFAKLSPEPDLALWAPFLAADTEFYRGNALLIVSDASDSPSMPNGSSESNSPSDSLTVLIEKVRAQRGQVGLKTLSDVLGTDLINELNASIVAQQGTRGELDLQSSLSDSVDETKGNLQTVFGFDAKRRALMVDYLVDQKNSRGKAKLTMSMVVNQLKKVAIEFGVEPNARGKYPFPNQLEVLKEKIEQHQLPRELTQSKKIPAIFSKLMLDYQNDRLKPEERYLAFVVIIAFLATEAS